MTPSSPTASNTRLLPLEAGFNLRDFGGYPTADGQRVRWGMVYRSGTMFLLTARDADHLHRLGIRWICDFRRQNEREVEPTTWHRDAGIDYWSRDYMEDSGVLSEILENAQTTAAEMQASMIELYREIPVDHAASFAELFRRMIAGDLPVLINCSAGKDRTGVAAALILSALGVPRERIEQDYLATNDHADWSRLIDRDDTILGRKLKCTPEVAAPLLLADPRYLDAMFDELDRQWGGLDAYLAAIGVDAAARMKLRDRLLE